MSIGCPTFLKVRDSRFILFDLDSKQTSWRGVVFLIVLFLGALGFAAALTLPAYRLIEWWHAHAVTRAVYESAHWLKSNGEFRVFVPLFLLPIIVALPWCLRWIPAQRRALESPFNVSTVRTWAYSFGLGLAFVAMLAAVQLTLAPVQVRPGGHLRGIFEHLPLAIGKGFVEEFIFCGLVLRIFYTATRRPWLALVPTSALFAYLQLSHHYFYAPVGPTVGWDSGWIIAFWIIFGVVSEFDVMRFVLQFLLGMVLGVITLRSRSLWPAIGLHGGMLMGIMSYQDQYVLETQSGSFLGRLADIGNGWLAAGVLGVVFLSIVMWKPKASSIDASRS